MKVYDPDPAINERIRRAVRYGQTRWAEVWNSVTMVAVGGVLLYPEPTFVGPQWRVIAAMVTETTAGSIALAAGAARLIINGRRGRETSFVRMLGCVGGFFFWLACSIGFVLAVPPLNLGLVLFTILAISELHSSGRAASDMAAEDTFSSDGGGHPARAGAGRRPRRATPRRGGRPVADPLASLDSWPAIAIGITAAVAGALVPLKGFVKTLLDYCIEARKAEALKPETARDIATCSGGAVFDSLAIADLTAAVKGLTAAIVADTASDQAHHASQITEVMGRLVPVLERLDEREPPPTRPGRAHR